MCVDILRHVDWTAAPSDGGTIILDITITIGYFTLAIDLLCLRAGLMAGAQTLLDPVHLPVHVQQDPPPPPPQLPPPFRASEGNKLQLTHRWHRCVVAMAAGLCVVSGRLKRVS